MPYTIEQQEQLPANEGRQKNGSWLHRNWKWFIPVGCFGMFALFISFIALILYLVFTLGTSSDVYKEALVMAQKDPAVMELLGEPVEGGWYVTGKISISGPAGFADIAFPIHGPKGQATIYAVARKSAGLWNYSTLVVEIEKNGNRISLLQETI